MSNLPNLNNDEKELILSLARIELIDRINKELNFLKEYPESKISNHWLKIYMPLLDKIDILCKNIYQLHILP